VISSSGSIGSPSGITAFGEELLQFLKEQRQVGLHGFPNDLKIDVAVVMHHTVAHADDFVERDVRKLGAGFRGQTRCSFSGYQYAPQDRILRLAVLEELLVR
jgi:hypothetical protein